MMQKKLHRCLKRSNTLCLCTIHLENLENTKRAAPKPVTYRLFAFMCSGFLPKPTQPLVPYIIKIVHVIYKKHKSSNECTFYQSVRKMLIVSRRDRFWKKCLLRVQPCGLRFYWSAPSLSVRLTLQVIALHASMAWRTNLKSWMDWPKLMKFQHHSKRRSRNPIRERVHQVRRRMKATLKAGPRYRKPGWTLGAWYDCAKFWRFQVIWKLSSGWSFYMAWSCIAAYDAYGGRNAFKSTSEQNFKYFFLTRTTFAVCTSMPMLISHKKKKSLVFPLPVSENANCNFWGFLSLDGNDLFLFT